MTDAKSLVTTITVEVCQNPVFIIGSHRSGTTGLAAALQTHPDLWSSDESQILWDLFGNGCLEKNYSRSGPDGSWLLKQDVSRPDFLRFLGIGLNALFTSQTGGKRWIDHTPLYTLLVCDLAEMFPDAMFVHIQRDGRRVVHSMMNFAHLLGDRSSVGSSWELEPWALDFVEACRTWAEFVSAARAFAETEPRRCLTVTMEALTADPQREFTELYNFLGLTPNPSPIKFFTSTRVNSSFGPSGPVDVQPWFSWTEDEVEVFNREAGSLLVECGYEGVAEEPVSTA